MSLRNSCRIATACRLLLPPQTFILWFGWYGFNAGSILSLTLGDRHLIASHAAINTTLSAAAGCVAALFLSTVVAEHYTGEVTFNLQYASESLKAVTARSMLQHGGC